MNAATLVPAWRAPRTNPLIAVRHEEIEGGCTL